MKRILLTDGAFSVPKNVLGGKDEGLGDNDSSTLRSLILAGLETYGVLEAILVQEVIRCVSMSCAAIIRISARLSSLWGIFRAICNLALWSVKMICYGTLLTYPFW